jgi:hypothetical protein
LFGVIERIIDYKRDNTENLEETETVEEGLYMSTVMSRAFWLIGMDQPRGGKVQQGRLAEKQDTLTWSGWSIINNNMPQLLCSCHLCNWNHENLTCISTCFLIHAV